MTALEQALSYGKLPVANRGQTCLAGGAFPVIALTRRTPPKKELP